jgi:formylglycine-generating enzyme required for sulfatase activity
MLPIPAGSFLMGSQPGPGIPDAETPSHEVELPAYQIGKFPVTQKEFAVFTKMTGKVVPSLGWPGREPAVDQLNYPVQGVNWFLAMEYCQWLYEETGRRYALPTEAEWEYAARGPDGNIYPWGDNWLEDRCNATTNPTPVDQFPSQSIFNCYDLVGNVREWTCSLWGPRPRTPDPKYTYSEESKDLDWAPTSLRNNLAANSQIRRVYRGGVWGKIEKMRCAFRKGNLPTAKFDLFKHGFRVVLRS